MQGTHCDRNLEYHVRIGVEFSSECSLPKGLVAVSLRERLVLDEPGCDRTELAAKINELGLGCHIRIRKKMTICKIPVIVSLHTHVHQDIQR